MLARRPDRTHTVHMVGRPSDGRSNLSREGVQGVPSRSKEALKRALNGLAADIQANDADDIEYDNIVSRVSKGR